MTDQRVLDTLRGVQDPSLERDIVSLNLVQDLKIRGNKVSFTLDCLTPLNSHAEKMVQACHRVLEEASFRVKKIQLNAKTRAIRVMQKQPVPGVKNLVAIASGKGGVGKSTLTVNLALALAREGARVGVVDCDIYGPSIPSMVGLHESVQADKDQNFVPHKRFGVQWLSMGFLIPRGQALAWRGPMLHKVIQQFIYQVKWDDLDYLLLDLPPGTGDVQLSLTEQPPLSAAVIVSTPQEVALIDVRKGYEMFEKVNVPVLGLVENMSWFKCGSCDKKHFIFGKDGAQNMAARIGVPFLGQLPLDPAIPSKMGSGEPLVFRDPSSPQAEAFFELAEKIAIAICRRSEEPVVPRDPNAMEV